MLADPKSVESLVELITREVISAYQPQVQPATAGKYCKVETVNDLKVTTCFNTLGEVVSAGAERITTTLGAIPDDLAMAAYIDHTLLKPEATREQVTQLGRAHV